MPTASSPDPWELSGLPDHLGCGSWADDFVHLHSQDMSAGLSRSVQRITSIYVAQADAVGMSLTFAADKTAVLLPPRARERDADWVGALMTKALHSWQQPGQRTILPAPYRQCILSPGWHRHRQHDTGTGHRAEVRACGQHCSLPRPQAVWVPTRAARHEKMSPAVPCPFEVCLRQRGHSLWLCTALSDLDTILHRAMARAVYAQPAPQDSTCLRGPRQGTGSHPSSCACLGQISVAAATCLHRSSHSCASPVGTVGSRSAAFLVSGGSQGHRACCSVHRRRTSIAPLPGHQCEPYWKLCRRMLHGGLDS